MRFLYVCLLLDLCDYFLCVCVYLRVCEYVCCVGMYLCVLVFVCVDKQIFVSRCALLCVFVCICVCVYVFLMLFCVRICDVVSASMCVFWVRVSVCFPCWLMFVLIEGHGCWMCSCGWGGVTAVCV